VLLGTTSVAALGLVLAATTPSGATDWTGTISTDWFTAGNWSAGIPTSAVNAIIDTVAPHATVVGVPGAQADRLSVGNSGTGTLTIQGGGTVSNNIGFIGVNSGSTGTVTVTGAGSTWTNPFGLLVGRTGTGTLTIQNGGAVSDSSGVAAFGSSIATTVGSIGTVTVTGAGSTWTDVVHIIVGDGGTGTLTIQNGGVVSSGLSSSIGGGLGSTGTVTVTGAGSTWNTGDLLAGDNGTGTLTIQNGGAVSSGNSVIGRVGSAIGTVTVTGAGSTWTNSGSLNVGRFSGGTGTLTIQSGGAVNVTGSMTIAQTVGSTGTLNIGAASGQAAAAPGTLNASSVAFGAGTGRIVFNHTASNYTFAPTISGNGAVRVEAPTPIRAGPRSAPARCR
jgi:T5SS/PEP-CTERM-associated repeat protein